MFRRIAQLGVLSLVVAVLALVQNRLMVQGLGAGSVVDGYYLAQTLPMAVVTMTGLVLTSLFVPLFVRRESAGVLEGSTALCIIVALLLALFIAVQVPLSMVLGFWRPAEYGWGWLLAVGIGAAAYGVSFYGRTLSVAVERADWFVWAQIANALLFIGLLASGVVRGPLALALAFMVSALLQSALVFLPLVRSGLMDPLPWRLPEGLAEHLKIGLFASLLGVAFMQGTTAVDRWYAESLGTGIVTTYYLADRIIQMTLMLVTTAVGLVVFPRMAIDANDEGSKVTTQSLVGLVAFLAPLSSVIWVYAPALMRVLFGGGLFGAAAVSQSALFLSVLALGLLPMGLVFVLPRRLQASGGYFGYAFVAGLLFAAQWLLKATLTPVFGANGLAPATVLAFAAGAVVYLAILWGRRLMRVGGRDLRDMFVPIGLAIVHGAALMAVPGARNSFWAAPASLLVLWSAAAALGGRIERKTLHEGLAALRGVRS